MALASQVLESLIGDVCFEALFRVQEGKLELLCLRLLLKHLS